MKRSKGNMLKADRKYCEQTKQVRISDGENKCTSHFPDFCVRKQLKGMSFFFFFVNIELHVKFYIVFVNHSCFTRHFLNLAF